ncbi:S26 family signal peptidase [Mesorhizobium sp. WSM3868]|uniref:S26 family signal peptidase n=1 Tax=Mesorhizobium sp. WSM3868 TaxID=2029405 RepID=UPI000BB030DB|nr:S26 family signal peptidase [Mesorhizobium sp. WSM3868]PBB37067.1 hypothetical protein CK221_13200 [Mesorhizobium sp. WSM3868]
MRFHANGEPLYLLVWVIDPDTSSAGDDMPEIVVPPDEFFMLGDNRDNLADSRFTGHGAVRQSRWQGSAPVLDGAYSAARQVVNESGE